MIHSLRKVREREVIKNTEIEENNVREILFNFSNISNFVTFGNGKM